MAQTNNWYSGSDMKFLVNITAQDFSMDDNDWGITVYIDNKPIKRYDKSDCVRDDEGEWYVCISREDIKKYGVLSLVADAAIPDTDFADGVRHDVGKLKIGTYSKI